MSSSLAKYNKIITSVNENVIKDTNSVHEDTVTDSVNNKQIANPGYVANEIVDRYNILIKRQTPRVGTSFCPNNKLSEDIFSCSKNPPFQVTKHSSDVLGSVSASFDLQAGSVTTGLDKYKRYMESKTGAIMQNYESRNIVGQEDNSDEHFSNVGESSGSANKGRKFSSRPPVVGQASSSSDSGSIVMDHHSPTPESDINSADEEPLNRISGMEFNSNQHQVSALSNRDDFISERPPEGSSEQESTTSVPDLQTELPRIPSPSSASSAASVRPLEWDSGADVGYYGLYPTNNPDIDSRLSTIERIALARGSAVLLTRSDPEGTTEHTSQIPGKVQSPKPVKRKLHLGIPVAESTPLGTNITGTPLAIEGGELSSINEPQSSLVNNDNQPYTSSGKTGHSNKPEPLYILFPELLEKGTNFNQCTDIEKANSERNTVRMTSNRQNVLKTSNKVYSNDCQDIKLRNKVSAPCESYDEEIFASTDLKTQQKMKLLSSSMEILNIKSVPSERECVTFPRSHSHNNIINEITSHGVNSLPKNLMLRGFVATKSASSSSVSTVVNKKRDSPKRISKLVQTTFVQQSIGTQVTGSEIPSIPISSSLPGFVAISNSSNTVPQVVNERSSYFSCPGSEDLTLEHQRNYDKGRTHSTSRHSQSNFLCSGAHKKSSKSSCPSRQNLGCLSHEQIVQDSGHDTHDRSGRNDMPTSNAFQNIRSNWDTSESVESSARSGQNMWAEQRESLVAEDRVNSFEYLPGHMYENAALKETDSHDTGTSSVSINHISSSRNEYSDETDKLWDASASSTLLRDIQRGVNLMAEFVKSSNVNNSHMKQKLVKKVVERLIKSDYLEDRLWSQDRPEGQWVSSQMSNIPDSNGRETRRSHNKNLPLSNRSSDRTPDYFHHLAAKEQHGNPRDPVEERVGTEQSSRMYEELHSKSKRLSGQSTSSDLASASGTSSAKPKSTADESVGHPVRSSTRLASSNLSKARKHQPLSSETVDSSSNSNAVTDRSQSVDSSGRVPDAMVEKVLEEKIKKQEKLLKKSKGITYSDTEILLEYLKLERDNQLLWIKSEIDHLSNLKRLLETQEELKKSLIKLRKRKIRSTLVGNIMKLGSSKSNTKEPTISSPRKGEKAKKSVTRSEEKDDKISQLSSDWSSHRYFGKREVSSSGIKELKEKKSDKTHTRESQEVNKLNKLSTANSILRNDERRQHSTDEDKEESNMVLDEDDDDGVCVHMRRSVGTETTDTVGIQTSKSVNQLPVIQPKWYSSQKSVKRGDNCICKQNNSSNVCESKNTEDNKKAVAYSITFDNKSRQDSKSMGIAKKENKRKHRHTTYSVNKIVGGYDNITGNSSDSSQMSDQKENYEPSDMVSANQQPTTLQDYLMRNRADYVSKAEYRRRCVAELAYLRELRDKSKRQLITLAPESSDLSQSTTPRELPPPPLAVKRVFSQKTMRRQTERKYRQLAEVQSRQLDMKRKEAYRTNRLMAEVFTKKLQRRALKGEVNLSNSVSVISSL